MIAKGKKKQGGGNRTWSNKMRRHIHHNHTFKLATRICKRLHSHYLKEMKENARTSSNIFQT